VSHLDRIEDSGFRIGRVIDLLSEASYQEVFDWGKVSERTSLIHRKFERLGDREALANMGIWLRSVVLNPQNLRSLELDSFFSIEGFLDDDRMKFEAYVE